MVERTTQRRGERGSSAIMTAMVMTAMVGVAGTSIVAVKRSLGIVGMQRNSTAAMYAAKAGVAAGTAYLKAEFTLAGGWSSLVEPSNVSPQIPADLPGQVQPSEFGPSGDHSASPFGNDTFYSVMVLNNENDPGFATGDDTDSIVTMRVTGFGPDSSRVVIEVDLVGPAALPGGDTSCGSYAQQGLSELGSGTNNCMGSVDSSSSTVLTPP